MPRRPVTPSVILAAMAKDYAAGGYKAASGRYIRWEDSPFNPVYSLDEIAKLVRSSPNTVRPVVKHMLKEGQLLMQLRVGRRGKNLYYPSYYEV